MAHTITISSGPFTFIAQKQESVLHAALRSGLSFPHSCREGNCGTCLGKVTGGEISYPEGLPLGLMESDHKAGWALFCVACAESDLHLDVKEVSDSSAPALYKTQVAKVLRIEPLGDDIIRVVLTLAYDKQQRREKDQALYILMEDERHRYIPVDYQAPADTDGSRLQLALHVYRDQNAFSKLVFDDLLTSGSLLRIASG